ncbi:MAG: hypothetical protein SFW67_08400 [Myxococcaceae bacterium]|nr:hypothetical protein [Myxococcaceae bacterium]
MMRRWLVLSVALPLVARAAPPMSLSLAVQNEAASLPSAERLFTRLNPGVEGGFGWRWHRMGRLDVVQDVVGGVWLHPGYATSLTARTTAGVRGRLVAGLQLGLGLTVGALVHDFEARTFSRQDTSFAPAPTLVPRFVGGLVVDAAWSFGRLTPYVSYGVLVEAPFLAKFSPVFPHQTLQLGVRIALGPVEATP